MQLLMRSLKEIPKLSEILDWNLHLGLEVLSDEVLNETQKTSSKVEIPKFPVQLERKMNFYSITRLAHTERRLRFHTPLSLTWTVAPRLLRAPNQNICYHNFWEVSVNATYPLGQNKSKYSKGCFS